MRSFRLDVADGVGYGRAACRTCRLGREHPTDSRTIAPAAPRIATKNTHGTGCSLSSAVAAGLAKGESLATAVRAAKAWISAAIAAADRLDVGHGHGPIHHFHRFY
jgi:hydroxymethylpyrimidine/phosphomethylpyrimidine kinase